MRPGFEVVEFALVIMTLMFAMAGSPLFAVWSMLLFWIHFK